MYIFNPTSWGTQWLWPIDRDRYPSLTAQPWASLRRHALWVPRLTSARRFRWNPANRDFDQQNIGIGWDLVEFNVIWKGSHWEISPEKCGIGRSSHRLVVLESTHQKIWISWLLGLNDHARSALTINSTDNLFQSWAYEFPLSTFFQKNYVQWKGWIWLEGNSCQAVQLSTKCRL